MADDDTKGRILVVEDEAPIALALEDGLRLEGFQVEVVGDGQAGLDRALADPAPDVMILDMRLPKLDGMEVLRRLRASGARLRVVALTARGSEADRVAGLECGADDYVTKPFSMAELLARIRVQLRRKSELAERSPGTEPASQELAEFGDVTVDFSGHRVVKGEQEVALSSLELKMLKLLWDERGRTVSRERFLREVWGYDHLPVTRTVDFHVQGLRRKLEDDPSKPCWIQTHHGVGYRLEA